MTASLVHDTSSPAQLWASSRPCAPSLAPRDDSTAEPLAEEELWSILGAKVKLLQAAMAAEKTIQRVHDELPRSRARAIDIVYDTLDPLLVTACIEEAQVLLRALAQNELPLAVLLSALTVSYPWRATLGDAREELAEKARGLARREGGDAKVREIARFL